MTEAEWRAEGCPRYPVHSTTFWSFMESGVLPDEFSSLDRLREDAEISLFLSRLSIGDRDLFIQGRRLTFKQRSLCLSHLTPERIVELGLIFPDDPLDSHPVRWSTEMRASDLPSVEQFRHSFRLATILMDGWHIIDPLQLDLIAAVVRCGGSRRYAGDRSVPTPIPKHGKKMIEDPSHFLTQCATEIADHLRSPFFPHPPFENGRYIAVNTVPKIRFRPSPSDPTLFFPDEGVRNISDFSVPYWFARLARVGLDSINASTLKSVVKMISWTEMLYSFLCVPSDGCFISSDYANAHNSVMVRPDDWHLGVIFIEGSGHMWCPRFQFGEVSASSQFDMFAEFDSVMHVTKFNFCSPENLWTDDRRAFAVSNAAGRLRLATWVYSSLRYGIRLGAGKLTPPCRVGEWTGFRWDVGSHSISFPPSKLAKYVELVDKYALLEAWTNQDIESLLGVLQYATRIMPNLAFICPLWRNLLSTRRARGLSDFGSFKPPAHIRAHLRLFRIYLIDNTPISALLLLNIKSDAQYVLYTDGSGTHGWGAFCATTGAYAFDTWTEGEIENFKKSSPFFECKSIVYGLLSLPFRDCIIELHCDNEALFKRWNNGSRYNANPAMNQVTDVLHLLLQQRGIVLHMKWIATNLNIFADSLSREQGPSGGEAIFLQRFSAKYPHGRAQRFPCPPFPSALSAISPGILWRVR